MDKVAGANGPDLVSKLSKYGSETTTTTTAASSTEDIKSRLEKLVNFAPVMLFMKGTPEQPQCGFSNKISDILKKNNVKFSSFNILSDDEVRQALKVRIRTTQKLISKLGIFKLANISSIICRRQTYWWT